MSVWAQRIHLVSLVYLAILRVLPAKRVKNVACHAGTLAMFWIDEKSRKSDNTVMFPLPSP